MKSSYDRIVTEVIKKACRIVRCPKNVEYAVLFIGDKKMRELNKQYRGKNKTTNVLAFACNAKCVTYNARDATRYTLHATHPLDLGDIFISLPEAKREAKKYEWTLKYEIARLALHGFLHLLGYDHEKEGDAQKMEGIEQKVLESF